MEEGFPQLDGYQLTGLLGRGGMATVYRAIQQGSGRAVAIKCLESDDPSLHRALANEWEVLIRVEHEYLVNELELIQTDKATFMVMELIEGVSLTDWIVQHSPQERLKAAPSLFLKLCDVLGYLHSQDPPVIVRDLKPDNILISENITPRLIDFGIARALTQNAVTEIALKGFASAAYAPLEQYSAQATTGVHSDIYSLGATLYHFLTGEAPKAAIDLLSEKTNLEQELVQKNIEPAWAALVAAAMRLKAQQRISLDEFRAKIEQILRPAPPPPSLPSPTARSVAPERPAWMSWGLILALLTIALLLLWTSPTPSP